MKKFTFILTILIALTINANAQSGWNLQINPLGSGDTAMLGKIQFASPLEGWISGGRGDLLHTTDAGANWTAVTPFPNDTVMSMSDPSVSMWWVNQTHGWKINAMGDSLENAHGAVIHKTSDGGITWEKNVISTDFGDFGLQVQFVDENNGWATVFNFQTGVFNTYSSSDGGNNWNLIPATAGGFFYFVDVNNGWLISAGPDMAPPYEIMKTTDGGVNWSVQYSDDTEGSFEEIQFTDLNNGWVVGRKGKILKTSDGGTNWTSLTNTGIANFDTYHSKCVFFIDATNGWIGSDVDEVDPIVLHTTDGGNSWIIQTTPINGTLSGGDDIFSIFFWDVNNGWFTGDNGIISHTTNGGMRIADNIISNSINFSPNPASDIVTININRNNNADLTLNIYNIMGSLVKTEMLKQNQQQINVGDLSNGIYMIEIKSKGLTERQKLIIQR